MNFKKALHYTLCLLGCLLLIVMILYFAISLYMKVNATREAGSDLIITEKMYSQEELDTALQKAIVEERTKVSATDPLQILKGYLQEGTTVVQSLREIYPNEIVLASGGRYHFIPIREDLAKNDYAEANMSILESGEIQYFVDEALASYKGIDVSKHNGEIDWQQVAADGVEFAFIRVGNRGYGSEGKLLEDTMFDANMAGALQAGVKVGVYFYTQAVNEQEMQEEIDLVLRKISPYKVECPVVIDVEKVSGADGRMNSISVEERTRLTAMFCEQIEKAGYKPMIYQNMEMGAMMLDLGQLEQYEKWFAYYNQDFYYPYAYSVWQYSDKGTVAGIKGNVDLNISFKPLWEE